MKKSSWKLNEKEQIEAINLLSELIRCQSPDPPGCEAEIAKHLLDWFNARGFITEADEFARGRVNLITRLPGGNKPALIFSAHMDTMAVGEGAWNYDPFGANIVNGKLYGRGAADMKSGLTAMAIAASKIKSSNFTKN